MKEAKVVDPFRVCLKVKVKEGNLEEFLSSIPPYVATIKDSEPNTLQFEAFCNREKREVVWLQSYENAEGFDAHLGNAELKDLQSNMMPLQEAVIDLYIMGQPTEATLYSLKKIGIEPTILTPWDGTIRLGEPRDENSNIQSIVAFEITDVEAYRKISEQVEAAAATQAGVAFHRSYQIGSTNNIVAFEEYANEKAVLDWVMVFAANSDNFASLVKSMTYNVYGNPTGKCKETLDAWGAIYYNKISGYTRFN